MSLINSTYFIGERNVPNTQYDGVDATLQLLIDTRENEYLQTILGYELNKLFLAGLQSPTVAQRYIDLLLGKEFTYQNKLIKWDGFVSITSPLPTVSVSVNAAPIVFTVGVTGGAPIAGDTSYINTALVDNVYKVEQRGFGFLEQLLSDNSNVATADIVANTSGGFTFLNGVTFTANDKFLVTVTENLISTSTATVVPQPDSPIADYVYYYWLKSMHTQTGGIGEVRPKAQNAIRVSPKHKACKAYNDMVDKSFKLYLFLKENITDYPEYAAYLNDCNIAKLLTHIHPFY